MILHDYHLEVIPKLGCIRYLVTIFYLFVVVFVFVFVFEVVIEVNNGILGFQLKLII